MCSLIIFILLLLALIFYLRKKLFSRLEILTENIPGPKGYPIIGAALEFGTKGVLSNMSRLTKEYSQKENIFKFWIGPKLYVCVFSPDDSRDVLSDEQSANKSSIYDLLDPLIGLNSIFTTNGEKWKKRKKLILPTFHMKMLDDFFYVFKSKSEILVENLRKEILKPAFDVSRYFNMCTMDVIVETAMGVNIDVQRKEDFVILFDILCQLEYLFIYRASRFWTHPNLIFNLLSQGRQQRQLLKKLNNIIQKIIEAKMKKRNKEVEDSSDVMKNEELFRKTKRRDFLDIFLDYGDDCEMEITSKDISDEVTAIIIGGISTTASTLSFVLYALMKHQNIQEKVYNELNEIFHGSNREVTFRDLQHMNYLEMIIKETLRIWTPAPYIVRKIEKDLKLRSGYTLPAGCDVWVLLFALHRNTEVFPNPKVFDPERFNRENSQGRGQYAFCPFSAGPRICLGQKYAYTELKVILSNVLRNYKILPPSADSPDITLSSHMILRSKTGVNIKIEKR